MDLDVVTFIYKLLNLNLEDAFHLWTCLHLCVNWTVFICGFLRLSWRGWIHKCIIFNKELSVANQMPPSFSANQMTAVTGFLHCGAVYYFNGTDKPKTQSKLDGKSV